MSTPPPGARGIGDFDFLVGSWDVTNRRLLAPLTGSTEWDEFPGTAVCHGTLFDGAANLDEISFPTKGCSGLTLRLFDPLRAQWSLNWVSSRTGLLSPPVVGRFHDEGHGDFYGEDTHEGTPVLCRFIWSRTTSASAHWEQAFSTDGGQSWETNWTMALRRAGEGSA